MSPHSSRAAHFAILVAALGYFVDVFDLWLFANFRVPSLTELGFSGQENTSNGAFLINCQQAGLLLGGFVWGIMGDRYGRASVMFASIVTYSLANIGNAFVTTLPTYAVLRFIAGFGLAGEIGAGVTLVSELLPKEKRGIGVTIVATVGVAGAIAAAYVGAHVSWRNGYLLGGVMGLALLALRMLVHESGMYKQMESAAGVRRGSLKLLFGSRERIGRFLACIAVGIPIWLVFGLYGVFAPELAKALEVTETILVPTALFYASIGITVGDLFSGLLSQKLRSRKQPMAIFMVLGLLLIFAMHAGLVTSATSFYAVLGGLGFFVGFWICAIATSAEQFGTNLRATVTTSVPNLVRATVIPINISFVALQPTFGVASSALIVACAGYSLALFALWKLKESFSRDLDFHEK
jgi:putative MFS transporter